METRKPLWKRARSRYRCYRGYVDRLTKIDWCYIIFKLSLGAVWPAAFFASSPESLVRLLGVPFMVLWLGCCTIGFFVSVTGLVMSAQLGAMRMRGLRIELSGLYLFMGGPLAYATVQLVLLVQTVWIALNDWNVAPAEYSAVFARVSQLCLAIALTAAVRARQWLVKMAYAKTARRAEVI